MQKRLDALLHLALAYHASDLHFHFFKGKLHIEIRSDEKLLPVKTVKDDEKLLKYLQYLANLDLGNLLKPQTGQFEWVIDGEVFSLRFALIQETQMINGVLRILNDQKHIVLAHLALNEAENAYLEKIVKLRTGLFIVSGPTSSGKTTTLYTMLKSAEGKKIFTVEDPVEVRFEDFIQIAVNEAIGLGYMEALKQVLRHDPDIIMIGEIRDEITAKAALHAANTGHLVLTSLHSGSCLQALERLKELGIETAELKNILVGITNQRLYQRIDQKGKAVIFELMNKNALNAYWEGKIIFASLQTQIRKAINKGVIDEKEAQADLLS